MGCSTDRDVGDGRGVGCALAVCVGCVDSTFGGAGLSAGLADSLSGGGVEVLAATSVRFAALTHNVTEEGGEILHHSPLSSSGITGAPRDNVPTISY